MLVTIVESGLLVAGIIVCIPSLVLLVEILAGALPTLKTMTVKAHEVRLAILIPAHNECSGIGPTVRQLLAHTRPTDRVIVVADNCTDQTAAIAAAAGASVIVRDDPLRRGKGYALDFGVRHLRSDPPDVVVIIDADCVIDPKCLDHLAQLCVQTGRPTQALYLMNPPAHASPRLQIAALAWVMKNYARPLGLLALGLPCHLMGSGMAFTWQCISRASLATGHIVEDMKLGLDMARAGTAPIFCPHAIVTSTFPTSESGVEKQRTRWEHGHLSVIQQETRSLLSQAISRGRGDLLALTLDLSVPPLALLVLIILGLGIATLVLGLAAGAWTPFWVSLFAGATLTVAVFMCWWRFGREIVSMSRLASAAAYLIWKLPLYCRFAVARQVSWIRSDRPGKSDDPR